MSKLLAITSSNKALFYTVNYKNDNEIKLLEEKANNENVRIAPHVNGKDKPGRAFDRFGEGKHAVEVIDPRDKQRKIFAKEIAEHIHELMSNSNYQSVILTSPPELLGEIREYINGKVEDKIVELNKDLTHVPLKELREILRKVDILV